MPRRIALFVAAGLALVCAGVWSVVYAEASHGSGHLTFAVLDVGQGDALYIESPTGVQVLVDGGPDDALLRALPVVMPLLDRSLDAIVETHPDADHIGGFVSLLERYEVGVFVAPGIPKNTATAHALEKKVDEQKIPRVLARRGMMIDLGDGVQLRVLYPDRDVSRLSDSKANDGCIVIQLVYKEASALLACDAPAAVEAHLLQTDGAALASDLLKVAHHGSKYSSTPEFVAAVRPRVAIISVGARNTYGHPTEQTLTTLEKSGAKIIRTDQKGTIVCTSDGADFECEL